MENGELKMENGECGCTNNSQFSILNSFKAPSLIVITAEDFFDGEAQAINLLFGEGLQCLHLRKPRSLKCAIQRLLDSIDYRYHTKIVLHDCFSLTEIYTLKGVHHNTRNTVFGRQSNLSVSRSCHSIDEIKLYSNEYDYLFLSPVFNSISKQGYIQAFTEHKLCYAHADGVINQKVIALGGIAPGNIATALQYGFGGVAVLGFLWGNFATDGNRQALTVRFKQLQHATKK